VKIQPLKGIIYLKIEEGKAGILDTSSRASAVEYATVLDIGEGVESVKKGDRVFVKAWAIDIVNYEDERYYFCAQETNGILAVVS